MLALIVFVVAKRYVFDKGRLTANHRFTVATVYKISYPAEGGPDADFEYCANGKIYRDYVSFNSNQQKISIGNKFLLKYYPSDPAISQILLNEPFDSTRKPDVDLVPCQTTTLR